ncbi:response regulator [Bremerella volcania]|uniref:response regulator n=1 Tax=Bremerella volcania TaxID=2527984 RepID=UPI0013FCFCFE|nr:response regulator [Bremerella volcania]
MDDEPDSCSSLCRIIRGNGYYADVAHTAKELFQPREWAEYFGIDLDRRLPDGLAEELLSGIKERAAQAAVIIITGYGDLDSSIAALRQGAEDYILKPVNPDDLRAKIAQINRCREAEEQAGRGVPSSWRPLARS